MNYNYYFFLLENYRRKINPDLDVLSIRKDVYQSYSNESFRQRQRYRHEMAKERRARMESQKLMNSKIRELKEKEKEISRRYARRNNYGSLIGTNSSIKSKFREERKDDSTIRVLLPMLKKKGDSSRFESSFNEGLDYGAYSIPKTMLPPGNEDIGAYEVVKAAQELCKKYRSKRYDEEENVHENGVRSKENEKINKEDFRLQKIVLTSADDDDSILRKEKLIKGKTNDPLEPNIVSLPRYRNGVENRKLLTKPQITSFPKHRFGPSYENVIHDYPCKRGDADSDSLAASLAVFGKAKKTYELLIVNEGPRSEEIRVEQKCCSNPRSFDILIIREKTPKIS